MTDTNESDTPIEDDEDTPEEVIENDLYMKYEGLAADVAGWTDDPIFLCDFEAALVEHLEKIGEEKAKPFVDALADLVARAVRAREQKPKRGLIA